MADDQGREGQRDWGGDTGALGGYGSAGLFSRRRQMERTSGGSYQNLANAPRAAAVGGYVSMPTVGPTPVSTEPKVSAPTGPTGPSVTAQGVAGNYNQAPPDVPQWGRTSSLAGRAIGAGIMGAGAALSNARIYRNPLTDAERGSGQKWVTKQSRNLLRDYKNTKATEDPWVQSERDLDEGVVTVRSGGPDSMRVLRDDELHVLPGGKRLKKMDYDPSLAGSGAGIEDVNLATGLPSTSAIGALSAGSPVMPGRRDTSQDVTPVNPADFADPAPTREGPIVVGTQRQLPPAGGSTRATTRFSSADEPQAGLVRQTTAGVPDYPGMRPSAEQDVVEQKAKLFEFGNAFQGQSAGRNATRAERNARKDSNQGQIYGFDWGNG